MARLSFPAFQALSTLSVSRVTEPSRSEPPTRTAGGRKRGYHRYQHQDGPAARERSGPWQQEVSPDA
jgi:hypothetical protein